MIPWIILGLVCLVIIIYGLTKMSTMAHGDETEEEHTWPPRY